jgi:hypothetical protein
MTKKVWTAAGMDRKGIRKMLEKFDPDPKKARKEIAKRKKDLGVNLGGLPVQYTECTSLNTLRKEQRQKTRTPPIQEWRLFVWSETDMRKIHAKS